MKIMDKIMRGHLLKMALIFVICMLVGAGLYAINVKNIINEPIEYVRISGSSEADYNQQVLKGHEIVQSFQMEGQLSGVKLRFSGTNKTDQGMVRIILLDDENQVLSLKEVKQQDVVENEFDTILFDEPMDLEAKRDYRIKLESVDDQGSSLSSYVTKESNAENSQLTIDGIEQSGDLQMTCLGSHHHYYRFYLLGIMVMMAFFSCLCYWFLFVKKIALEKLFLLMFGTLGILLIFIVPPYFGYDAEAHFDTAYRYSNVLLGKGYETENGAMDKRACDVSKEYLPVINRALDMSYMLARGFFKGDDNLELVTVEGNSVTTSPFYVYTPQILGITLSRLLNLNYVQMLYLVRTICMMVMAAFGYWAIRITPVGKKAFFMAGLSAVVIYQATGFSYDTAMIGLAFIFTAYCVKGRFDQGCFTNGELAVMMGSGILLAPCKLVYAFMALLVFMIPKNRFGSSSKYWKVILVSCCAVLVLLILTALPSMTSHFNASAPNISVETKTVAYSISFIWQQPVAYLIMVANTIYNSNYLYGMFNETFLSPIPPITYISFIVLSIVASFGQKDDVQCFNWRDRTLIIGVFLMILLALSVIFITITGAGARSIEGIQPRYFLPMLPMLLLMCRNKAVVFQKKIDREILAVAYGIQLMVVIYIFMSMLSL